MITPVQRYLDAARLAQLAPTDADKQRAAKRARKALADTLVDGDAGVADAVAAYRFELEEDERQRHAVEPGDDDFQPRGCAGSYISDTCGRL